MSVTVTEPSSLTEAVCLAVAFTMYGCDMVCDVEAPIHKYTKTAGTTQKITTKRMGLALNLADFAFVVNRPPLVVDMNPLLMRIGAYGRFRIAVSNNVFPLEMMRLKDIILL